jgi:hypothetical protein
MNGRVCDIMDGLTERFKNMAELFGEACVLMDSQNHVVAAARPVFAPSRF